jgi:Xaa-Pro dipeptidase
MEAVREAIKGEGLGICEAGIHGHGLSSQEYPRFRTHAAPGADAAALKSMEDEFRPGMVFCFNIDLVDPQWKAGETGTVFAETILVTGEGPRRMHAFPMDFQVIE